MKGGGSGCGYIQEYRNIRLANFYLCIDCCAKLVSDPENCWDLLLGLWVPSMSWSQCLNMYVLPSILHNQWDLPMHFGSLA